MERWDDGTAGCDGTLTLTLTSTWMQGRRVETTISRGRTTGGKAIDVDGGASRGPRSMEGPCKAREPGLHYSEVTTVHVQKFDFSHWG